MLNHHCNRNIILTQSKETLQRHYRNNQNSNRNCKQQTVKKGEKNDKPNQTYKRRRIEKIL